MTINLNTKYVSATTHHHVFSVNLRWFEHEVAEPVDVEGVL